MIELFPQASRRSVTGRVALGIFLLTALHAAPALADPDKVRLLAFADEPDPFSPAIIDEEKDLSSLILELAVRKTDGLRALEEQAEPADDKLFVARLTWEIYLPPPEEPPPEEPPPEEPPPEEPPPEEPPPEEPQEIRIALIEQEFPIVPPFETVFLPLEQGNAQGEFVKLVVANVWDGTDTEGEPVPDGTYLYRFSVDVVRVDVLGNGNTRETSLGDLASDEETPGEVTVDNTAPEITATLTPPANDNGWNNTDVTVTFDCSDAGGIEECPEPVLVTGDCVEEVVEGTAVDTGGSTTTVAVTVRIDKLPPSITGAFDLPPNANGWNNTPLTAIFEAVDGCSGVAAVTPPVLLDTEGANQEVTGTAIDLAGNLAGVTLVASIDLTPPVVVATPDPPANEAGWNNTAVTVLFDCQDDLSGVASCPEPVTLEGEGADQVVEGTAFDLADNSATAAASVSIDLTPPEFDPAEFRPFPCPELTLELQPQVRACFADVLSGVAEGTVALSVDGVDHTAAATITDGCIAWDPPDVFDPIEHQATIAAVDRAGNADSASWCFEVASPVLAIEIDSPAAGFLTRDDFVDVAGTVEDLAETVEVNGVVATVVAGSFQAFEVPLREGRNVLTAVARNARGGVGTASVTVVRDTTPPVVRIETPGGGAVLTSLQVDVAGLVNDLVTGTTINADDCQVFVNGVEAAVANRSFVLGDLLLKRGLNTIVAEARDRMGNAASHSIEVNVQDQVGQRIRLLAGNGQSGDVFADLAEPLIVVLEDANGDPVPGRPVSFTVSRGEGTLSAFPQQGTSVTVVSDDFGQASVSFRLGGRAGSGNNRVLATAPGFLGQVEFCVEAAAGLPVRVTTVSGDNQRGVVERPLPEPLVVLVTDRGGNPVGGVDVTFEVLHGGGSFDGSPVTVATTDLDGLADARWTLGVDEGSNNNTVGATFFGLAGSGATFTATAQRAGRATDTSLAGIVLDNQDDPVPGATVTIEGTALVTTTDAEGRFSIAGVPVGTIEMVVDGTTTSRPGVWPTLSFELITVSGRVNSPDRPVYLLPFDVANTAPADSDTDVTLSLANVPGAELTVFANSVTCADGSTDCEVSVTQVRSERVPMEPPMGSSFMLAWTIQPAGATFDPPARLCIPNTDLAPGQQAEVFSFDHDQGEFVAVGTATVLEDGSQLCSDPGFGVIKAGWHGCVPPPPPPTCVSSCDDGNVCTSDFCDEGVCRHEPTNEGGACDDGSGCSTRECQGGVCVTLSQEDDGTACDDNDECTENDACMGGACTGDTVDCDDMNECTDDSCDPVIGCVNSDNLAACDDEDPCTEDDHCDNGSCMAGTPKDCDDDNSCTMDMCDDTGACVNEPDPAMDGERCDDMSECMFATCMAGECVEDNMQADGTMCDDMDECTKDDMCMDGMCVGEDVDTSRFLDRVSVGLEVNANPQVVAKIQNLVNSIPGLGSIKLTEFKGGVSGKVKDCCDPDQGIIEQGIKEGSASLSLSARVKGLTIWGPPTISRIFDFKVAIIDVDFQAGIKADSSFSVAGEGGKRFNACEDEDCLFGSLKATLGITPKLTLETIICTETFWTTRSCIGLTVTPVSFNIAITGGFNWNKPTCDSGIDGFMKVLPITFKATFCLGVPSSICPGISIEVFPGFTVF